MDITIVICTHNRLKLLVRTLWFIKKAQYPRGVRIETLVMANDCSDGTRRWLATRSSSFFEESPLFFKWQEVTARGKSHALNQAIGTIQTPGIAFVDDDHRVDTMYLKMLVSAYDTHPGAQLFCGRIIPDWNGSEPSWIHDQGPYRIYPLPVPCFDLGNESFSIPEQGPCPGGGNLFLRRSAALLNGPFSTKLGPVGHNLSGSEDQEWVRRALAKGCPLQYIPDVIQFHYADPERLKLTYLLKKSYERSASVVLLSQNISERLIPGYLIKKILIYSYKFLTGVSGPEKRRFYLMRLFSSLGELKGHIQRWGQDRKRQNFGKKCVRIPQ